MTKIRDSRICLFMAVRIQTQARPAVNTRKIRIRMIELGLRDVDLARRWGVTGAAVTQVINGKRPTSLLLGKLAKALSVRLEEILMNGTNGKAKAA